MRRIHLVTTVILLIAPVVMGTAQHFLSTSGKEIVNENGTPVLLRGMGLGGWMLQEGYMLQTAGFANAQHEIRAKIEALIGEQKTDEFYEAWLQNHVTRADIDSLKSWGFNSVRLPMHYNLFTLPIEEEPVEGQQTWLDKGFELTDSLLAWCKANEMYVILDLHAAPGGQGRDAGISDYDPDKPSLWESEANRTKTVALWRRIAEYYKDEQWIGGYDLINETNWSMTGNILLRDLYFAITDAIRQVDTRHIIFIEGNWFANDFTGLTPPWDDNMVYSPHKYWSFNDQAAIQWVLDLRNQYNIPLYFGEWGENSNVWFRDAVILFEDNNIGWAVWPMKKIESIAGPLSVVKTAGYQALLDYWNGNGTKPSAEFAENALMEITEGLKIGNCIYQRDVIDAMFRQTQSDEAIPFKSHVVPGIIHTGDYDLGPAGSAYADTDLADYRVSTGNFTAWNRGWSYRNDGVDIEISQDDIFTNGYSIGFVADDEWMQYSIDVAEDAVYDINVRVASQNADGRFHFSVGEAAISNVVPVPNTGDWQAWQTVQAAGVILTQTDKELRLYIDEAEFNIGGFEVVRRAATTDFATAFKAANTASESSVRLDLNKPLEGPLPTSPASFEIQVNGMPVAISNVTLVESNTRSIILDVDIQFKSSDDIKISYSGNAINATDGVALSTFSLRPVQNNVAIIHAIPGKVEAEDFFFQSGIQLESTSDAGGGQNIGFLDPGDYLDYYVNVSQAGLYAVDYRTAALSESGGIEMQLIAPDGSASIVHAVRFPSTGGWQTWMNTTEELSLPAGQHQIRLVITHPLFNINWFEFSFLTSDNTPPAFSGVEVFPNPTSDVLHVRASRTHNGPIEIALINSIGETVHMERFNGGSELNEEFDIANFTPGVYVIRLRSDQGQHSTPIVIHRRD